MALNTDTSWSDYLRLIRFHFHFNFISVPLGAVFVTRNVTASLIGSLLLLYFSFNVLLYGGIYTINGIADMESDARHPTKRRRPLPSRAVSVRSAVLFSVLLLMGGFVSGLLLFGEVIFYLYLAFLAINIFYNLVGRRIPYLEIAVNGATHPLRFLMGVLLAGGKVPYLLLLAIFSLAFGMCGVRRIVEKEVCGWEARETLKFYSFRELWVLKSLPPLAILLLMAADTSISKWFYVAALAVYLALAFGSDFSRRFKRSLLVVWTR